MEFAANLQNEIDKEIAISKKLKALSQKPKTVDINKLNPEQYRVLEELRRKIKKSNEISDEKTGQISRFQTSNSVVIWNLFELNEF